MSTPSRTPHRPYIPAIDTSAPRRVKDDYVSYSGWETPLSAQDRRRPSLTHSMMSELSPTSLPSTPGYNSLHGSFYMPNGIVAPVRGMGYMKSDMEAARPMQDLPYDMVMIDDKYRPAVLNTHGDRYQSNILMSPIDDSLASSFSSSNNGPSWDNVSHPNAQQFLFRPNPVQRNDSFTDATQLTRSLTDSIMSQVPATSALEDLQVSNFLSPQQLVIPTDIAEQDGYTYVQHSADSSIHTPVEQTQLHSASFDSLSSMSPWSQIEGSSPINEYSLPGHDLVGSGSVLMKEDPSMSVMSSQSEYEQLPHTPRRSRLRHRPSSAKRSRLATDRLTHRVFDIDVSIDTRGLALTSEGKVVKKSNSMTKKYECSHVGCTSRSARKEHLRRHELSHQPEKQFHCNLPKCNRAITRSDNLIQHLMTHVRPAKPGKRNEHHEPKVVERMVLQTMQDAKLAERTIINLRKAIEREQDRWPQNMNGEDIDTEDMDWSDSKAGAMHDEEIEKLKFEN